MGVKIGLKIPNTLGKFQKMPACARDVNWVVTLNMA